MKEFIKLARQLISDYADAASPQLAQCAGFLLLPDNGILERIIAIGMQQRAKTVGLHHKGKSV
jgi:hypothetical protein